MLCECLTPSTAPCMFCTQVYNLETSDSHPCLYTPTFSPTHTPTHRPKPGHYLQYALARLIASNITVLFSQSQGTAPTKHYLPLPALVEYCFLCLINGQKILLPCL